jgi:hypothetical protein
MKTEKAYNQKLEKEEIPQIPKRPEVAPGITKEPKAPSVRPEEHPVVKPVPNKPSVVPPDVKPEKSAPEIKPVKK